jgi:hypothetical protein
MKLSIDTRPHIRTVLEPFLSLDLLREGVWLGGGAIRDALRDNADVVDYDMFFANVLEAQRTALYLEDDLGFECIFKCPQGELTTFKKDNLKIQLITKFFYNSMEDLIDTFDITACCHATDGKIIVTKYSSVRDTFNKKINLHRIDFPNATMKRIQKYIQKGFVLTNKAVEKYVDRIYVAGATNEFMDLRFYVD